MFKRFVTKLVSQFRNRNNSSDQSDLPLTPSRAAAARRKLYADWLSSNGADTSELENLTRTTVERDICNPSALESTSPLKNKMHDITRFDYGSSRLKNAYSEYVNKNDAIIKCGREFDHSKLEGGVHLPLVNRQPNPFYRPSLELYNQTTHPQPAQIEQTNPLQVLDSEFEEIRAREEKLIREIDQAEVRAKMATMDGDTTTAHELVDWLIRTAMQNNVPTKVLRRLAQSRYAKVRATVAVNQNVPVDLMWFLGRDPSSEVRSALAKYRNTPLELLRGLAKDQNTFVSQTAKETISRLGAWTEENQALSA